MRFPAKKNLYFPLPQESMRTTFHYPESPYRRTFADVIAKISRMDSLPNYLSYGAPLARARSSAIKPLFLYAQIHAECGVSGIFMEWVHFAFKKQDSESSVIFWYDFSFNQPESNKRSAFPSLNSFRTLLWKSTSFPGWSLIKNNVISLRYIGGQEVMLSLSFA